jgi:nitrite reductase/ring-hydroxylating ferredoxin subunit
MGKALNAVGAAMVAASAWMGGELSFRLGVGVDETAHEARPTDWVPALDEAELSEGDAKKVTVGEAEVFLTRQGGRVYALAETCAHRGGPLHEGEIQDGQVICPWHGSCFSLEDGAVIRGPSAYPQPRYETRSVDGKIEIRAG